MGSVKVMLLDGAVCGRAERAEYLVTNGVASAASLGDEDP
jgi:hypothetical protein